MFEEDEELSLVKDYFDVFGMMPEDEVMEFIVWASGGAKSQEHAFDLWNKHHGDKLLLKEDGRPAEDIPKMIEIWRKEIGNG